ncbi:phage tail assembly protein [Rhodomicrobium udaipurense]|uniref:Phage tail assembly protein n=1 Tax=Rhodomicrobium udaipurense TaxID=1202716 RepID=A0A8I1GH37_9HYPH|nr:phage tail assembly protein [Rhodomicrobium udaipurense]MBJ7543275.1 phage tail assembly protein [Rhodomicrobium udaipurense]
MTTEQKFTLEFPVKVGGKAFNLLTLRRPKVRDVRDVERVRQADGDFAAGIALAAVVTGLPVDAVEDMDAADFMKLSEAVAGFMPRATPATGEPTPQT